MGKACRDKRSENIVYMHEALSMAALCMREPIHLACVYSHNMYGLIEAPPCEDLPSLTTFIIDNN